MRVPLLSARAWWSRRSRPTRSCSLLPPARRAPRHRLGGRRSDALPAVRPPARRTWQRGEGAPRSSSSRPCCPLPGTIDDPRRDALARVLDELDGPACRRGAPDAARCGRARTPRRPRAARLAPAPRRARDFRGSLVVHDCEADDLVRLETDAEVAVRIHPALVETDLVVTVTAAETVLHGGPAALLGACSAGALRAAGAESLLEPHTSSGWALACAIESALARQVPVLGVSILLDLPQATGPFSGYPWDPEARTALADSVLRRLLNAAPGSGAPRSASTRRARALTGRGHGRPSLGRPRRGAAPRDLAARDDARGAARHDRRPAPVEGRPSAPRGPEPGHCGRDRARSRAAALAGPPTAREGGTIVLLHPFSRTTGHGPQAPYRALLAALRDGPAGARVREAEAVAGRDRRAWPRIAPGGRPTRGCRSPTGTRARPALERAGRVIVAGCRDASGGALARLRAEPQPRDRDRHGARASRRRPARRAARAALRPVARRLPSALLIAAAELVARAGR